jgi:hypothetical protein
MLLSNIAANLENHRFVSGVIKRSGDNRLPFKITNLLGDEPPGDDEVSASPYFGFGVPFPVRGQT